MYWNFRVFKDDNDGHTIRRVYYDERGNPKMFSERPCSPFGESLEILEKEIEMMKAALWKPVIDKYIFPKSLEDEWE